MTHLFLGKNYFETMITIPAELKKQTKKNVIYVNYIHDLIVSVYVSSISEGAEGQ